MDEIFELKRTLGIIWEEESENQGDEVANSGPYSLPEAKPGSHLGVWTQIS